MLTVFYDSVPIISLGISHNTSNSWGKARITGITCYCICHGFFHDDRMFSNWM